MLPSMPRSESINAKLTLAVAVHLLLQNTATSEFYVADKQQYVCIYASMNECILVLIITSHVQASEAITLADYQS
jgi:hypothetical protein